MKSKKPNKLQLALQNTLNDSSGFNIPTRQQFQRWVSAALIGRREHAELTIRIVDEHESAELNQTYRHKTGPTNVLSFPFEPPAGIDLPLLGDLVICAPVVTKEALAQEKNEIAHWAHMVIHGTLHLLGYDHIDESEAVTMERIEINTLADLGYPNPYISHTL